MIGGIKNLWRFETTHNQVHTPFDYPHTRLMIRSANDANAPFMYCWLVRLRLFKRLVAQSVD